MQITLSAGDVFTFKSGSGVVIGDNVAVLITDEDSRMGPKIKRDEVPTDAFPAKIEKLKYESQMVITGALVASNLPVPTVEE
jgi:hypothetical protein